MNLFHDRILHLDIGLFAGLIFLVRPLSRLGLDLDCSDSHADAADRAEAGDLKQDYGSINGLIEAGKIEFDQAQQLLDLLDIRSKALMARIGERMADTFGTDPNVFITAEDDEE